MLSSALGGSGSEIGLCIIFPISEKNVLGDHIESVYYFWYMEILMLLILLIQEHGKFLFFF